MEESINKKEKKLIICEFCGLFENNSNIKEFSIEEELNMDILINKFKTLNINLDNTKNN